MICLGLYSIYLNKIFLNAERSIASMIVYLSLLAVFPVFKVQLRCDRMLQSLSYYMSLKLMWAEVLLNTLQRLVAQTCSRLWSHWCASWSHTEEEIKLSGRSVLALSWLEGFSLRKVQQTLLRRSSGKSLLLFSAQLGQCRTTLRLFDDLSMLAYSHSYGLGGGEHDPAVRWISVLNNMADQLYYPCEHIAWAADAELIKIKSDKWWLFSTMLWGTSLLLGILRSLRVLMLLKKKLKKHERAGGGGSNAQLHRQMRAELLSSLKSMADLSNAIHWMPPGFLWAGKFPSWLVGLMGTISSVIGLIQVTNTDQASDT